MCDKNIFPDSKIGSQSTVRAMNRLPYISYPSLYLVGYRHNTDVAIKAKNRRSRNFESFLFYRSFWRNRESVH